MIRPNPTPGVLLVAFWRDILGALGVLAALAVLWSVL